MKKLLCLLFIAPVCILAQTTDPGSFQDIVEAERNGRNAVIKLTVDAEALFLSGNSPNLGTNNPDLKYCSIWSIPGSNGPNFDEGAEVKGHQSDVFSGGIVNWIGFVDNSSRAKGFSIKLLQIEVLGDNCAFVENNIRGQSGVLQTTINSGAKPDCKTRYALWFEIENRIGETKAFRLDPWVIIRR